MKVLKPREVLSDEDRRLYTEEIDIPLTEAEMQRLEAEAAALGISVYDLIEHRLKEALDHEESRPPVSLCMASLQKVAKDLPEMQTAICGVSDIKRAIAGIPQSYP